MINKQIVTYTYINIQIQEIESNMFSEAELCVPASMEEMIIMLKVLGVFPGGPVVFMIIVY
jgi:hypothetical protein